MRSRFTVVAVLIAIAIATVPGVAQAPTSGIDLSALDKSVRPQDDLFRYVNGGWLAKTEIPADRPMYGTFTQLADQTETDLRTLIEGLQKHASEPGTPAQQISDLYASFMDDTTLSSLGAAPLKPRLA